MNEKTNEMLNAVHSKVIYSSSCLNAWANKLDMLFEGIASRRNFKPYKPDMDDYELRFQAAYIWMEQNFDVLASNLRLIDVLIDEADELLYEVEAAAKREEKISEIKELIASQP